MASTGNEGNSTSQSKLERRKTVFTEASMEAAPFVDVSSLSCQDCKEWNPVRDEDESEDSVEAFVNGIEIDSDENDEDVKVTNETRGNISNDGTYTVRSEPKLIVFYSLLFNLFKFFTPDLSLKLDAFKLLLPKEKKVDCLEDLGALTIKELKHFLVQYREKTSGVKADLILRAYAVFCHAKNFNSQSNDISDESSLLCHENDFTFEAIYDQCKHLPWIADLCGTPHFTFLQLHEYLVIRITSH
eukprot:gene10099-18752_t